MFSVFRNYISWHYSVAYVDQLYIVKNYFWFLGRFFSVSEVLKSLFAPWKRLHEEKGNLIHSPGQFFGALIVNTIMRIVGFLIRTIFLAVALILTIFCACVYAVVTVCWTVLPFLVIYFFIKGIMLITI